MLRGKKNHTLKSILFSIFSKADKNIPNSTKVSVEVTPPMNGVADVDEVGRFLSNHACIDCMCTHSAHVITEKFP